MSKLPIVQNDNNVQKSSFSAEKHYYIKKNQSIIKGSSAVDEIVLPLASQSS